MADYSEEFAAIARAYEASGGDAALLFNKRFAGLVVSHHRILYRNSIPGVLIEGQETPTGARARITVSPGTVAANPVHLCFGVLPKEGLQEIVSEFEIGEGAKVNFFAHCSFPNATKVKHIMDARVHVGAHAEMAYSETHYHGEEGGVEVLPVARVVVEDGGIFKNKFKLIQGAAGDVRLDYEVELKKRRGGRTRRQNLRKEAGQDPGEGIVVSQWREGARPCKEPDRGIGPMHQRSGRRSGGQRARCKGTRGLR